MKLENSMVKVSRDCFRSLLFLVLMVSLGRAEETQSNVDPLAGLGVPSVVASVNGSDIHASQLKFELRRLMRSLKGSLSRDDRTRLVKTMIEKELVRKLIKQEGKRLGRTANKEEIEKELTHLKKSYPDEATFNKALAEREIDENTLRESIRVDLIGRQFLSEHIKGKIDVKDADVKEFYEKNKETKYKRPLSFRSQHIFIAFIPPDMKAMESSSTIKKKAAQLKENAKRRILKIQKELKDGGDFGALAKKYSEDAGSADRGGDLGFIYKGIFDPTFDETVGNLKPNEVSDVVETGYGYHLIKLNETRPSDIAPLDSSLEKEIQRFLFMDKAKKMSMQYIENLKSKAKIERFF